MISAVNPICGFTIVPFTTATWITKQESFLVHISTIALPDVLTEWNAWFPCMILNSYRCDHSTSTTSQKYLCTRVFLDDWSSCLLASCPITEEHHETMVFTSQMREIVVNFISYLRNAVLMHASAPSCSPFPCPVSKQFQICGTLCLLWRIHNHWKTREFLNFPTQPSDQIQCCSIYMLLSSRCL